jgi:hypothetical protein
MSSVPDGPPRRYTRIGPVSLWHVEVLPHRLMHWIPLTPQFFQRSLYFFERSARLWLAHSWSRAPSSSRCSCTSSGEATHGYMPLKRMASLS